MGAIYLQTNRRKQPTNKSHSGVSYQNLARKLRKLFDNGFITKKVRTAFAQAGSLPDVFTLTQKGALRVASMLHQDISYPELFHIHKPHRGNSQYSLCHDLQVTSAMVTLLLSAYLRQYKVVYFATDKQIGHQFQANIDGKSKKYSFIADGFLILENLKTGFRTTYFIEIDRGTQALTRKVTQRQRDIRLKLETYYLFHLSNEFKTFLKTLYRKYELNPEGLSPEKLPKSWIDNFQLLYITQAEQRRRNVYQLLVNIIDDNRMENFRKDNQVKGKKSGMFNLNTFEYFDHPFIVKREKRSKVTGKSYIQKLPWFKNALWHLSQWRKIDPDRNNIRGIIGTLW